MLSYSIMTLVDTLFVGRLGASALAGVGLGGVAAFTVLCFGFGLLRGVKILVSQAVGAGRTTSSVSSCATKHSTSSSRDTKAGRSLSHLSPTKMAPLTIT